MNKFGNKGLPSGAYKAILSVRSITGDEFSSDPVKIIVDTIKPKINLSYSGINFLLRSGKQIIDENEEEFFFMFKIEIPRGLLFTSSIFFFAVEQAPRVKMAMNNINLYIVY